MIEELAAFVSTHLALVTLLMPWKKILVTDAEESPATVSTVLHTVWDLLNVDHWYHRMSVDQDPPVPVVDEGARSAVLIMFSLAVISLLVAITSFLVRLKQPNINSNALSIIDFTSWGTVLGLLVSFLVSQSRLDEAFAFWYRPGLPGEITADTAAVLLPVGVIVVHLAVLSYFVGKDIVERLRS